MNNAQLEALKVLVSWARVTPLDAAEPYALEFEAGLEKLLEHYAKRYEEDKP